VKQICNLDEVEGLNYKIGGLRIGLQIDFKIQGPKCKIYKEDWTMG
jgi:hypothetical protein